MYLIEFQNFGNKNFNSSHMNKVQFNKPGIKSTGCLKNQQIKNGAARKFFGPSYFVTALARCHH